MSRPVTRRSTSSEPNQRVQMEVRKQPTQDGAGCPKRETGVVRMSDKAEEIAAPSSKRLRSTSVGQLSSTSELESFDTANDAPRKRKPRNGTKILKKKLASVDRAKAARPVKNRQENGAGYHQKRKAEGDVQDRDDQDPALSDPSTLVDTTAALLATLDRRAHARALLQDADAILSEIVMPMSFPWAHRIKPVIKSIPHDIDDLFGIRSTIAGGEVTDDMRHGKFENARTHSYSAPTLPGTTWAAVKRSQDPGVIEYSKISPPTWAQLESQAVPFRPHREDLCDPQIPGEISLRAFEEAQDRRTQSNYLASTHLRTQLVSFRAGSTSSRSTILDKSCIAVDRSLVLLEALLPSSVQDGVPQNETLVTDESLGSYDCGIEATNEAGSQLVNGRTRRIWTAEQAVSKRPKGYVSLLTGQRLENGSLKRPRSVTVCLRMNGALLSTTDAASVAARAYDSDLVVEIIESPNSPGAEVESWPGSHQQCTMDRAVLITRLQEHRFDPDIPNRLRPVQKPFSLSLVTKLKFPLPVLNVVPPQIDCMPCEEGRIFTTCTSRGRLYTSRPPTIVTSTHPTSSSSVSGKDLAASPCTLTPVPSEHKTSPCSFLDITAMDRNSCSVCWSQSVPTTELGRVSLLRCTGCGILVHRSCCSRPPTMNDWKCDACLDYDARLPRPAFSQHGAAESREMYTSHRWSLRCSECGILGGTLTREGSRDGEEREFRHEVCRIWGRSQMHAGLFCSLCNQNSGPVLQCIADNCHVMFHPICALVASNAAAWKRQHGNAKRPSNFEDRIDALMSDDEFLCTQFRLSTVQIGSTATGDKVTAPVAFCGYHNPDRRADLYGLYPAGRYLANGVMRIPPFHGSVDASDSDDDEEGE